jgi:hypothetical protein
MRKSPTELRAGGYVDVPGARIVGTLMLIISCAATLVASCADAAPSPSGVTAKTVWSADLEARCPVAIANERRLAKRFESHRPVVGAPTSPALRSELLRMRRLDQDARALLMKQAITARNFDITVKPIDARNLKALKRIFAKYGVPTPALVGYDGLNAAWLLLQHATSDPTWQRQWLPAIQRLAERNELSPQRYALFVDRVRLSEGAKQIYGSVFGETDGRSVLAPTVDPMHLDERRKAMGLIPESEYECIIEAMYSPRPK